MTIPSKTRALLNKFRCVYHIKLAEKRGIKISSSSFNILNDDIEIQRMVTRKLLFEKMLGFFCIKNLIRRSK